MMWKVLTVLGFVVVGEQTAMGCKNCINLGKEEKAMFRAHSESCLATSQVQPSLVTAMLSGELVDAPAVRKHVYCVLLKCKIISKDGKLQKNSVLSKMAVRPDAKNATKILESCAQQSGDSPEDAAWNLFKCGYDKKALLFAYMPNVGDSTDNNENIN